MSGVVRRVGGRRVVAARAALAMRYVLRSIRSPLAVALRGGGEMPRLGRWIGAVVAFAVLGAGCFGGQGSHPVNSAAPGSIRAGLYRTAGGIQGGHACYWERQGAGGTVIAKVFPHGAAGYEAGPLYVDIKPTDANFWAFGCDLWVLAPLVRPLAVPGQPFGAGDYMVGREVSPGVYRAPGTSSLDPLHACAWQRVRGWSGEAPDYLDGGASTFGGVQVTIAPTDVGFRSTDCGTWTKIG
jgi:hypothetical protein